MKLSNERIINDATALGTLSRRELPVKVSYAIAKNIAKIERELKIYTNERVKLIDKYALKDKKGNVKADDNGQIIFKDGCKEKWDKDIRDLLDIEVEVDIHKFKLDELINSGCSMTPSELMLIDYMIEE